MAAIEDRLEEEERKLEERATALRRKSCDLFKRVSDVKKAGVASVVDVVTRVETAEVTEDGEIREVLVTSL